VDNKVPRPGDACSRLSLDTKGKPIKRRGRFVPVVVGVERRDESTNPPTVEAGLQFVFDERRIAAPGMPAEARLGDLYQLCSRYHRARMLFDAALDAGRAAIQMLDVGDDALPSTGLRPRRQALSAAISAADRLDAAGDQLDALVGVKQLAKTARDAAEVLDALMRAGSDAAFYDAWSKWRAIESRLAVNEAAQKRRHAAMRAVFDLGDAKELLFAQTLDDESPLALGALGGEDLPILTAPWSSVAWRGWRSAGLGVGVEAAWDNWPPLEQFALATIGSARGASAEAVKKSRQRNPAI